MLLKDKNHHPNQVFWKCPTTGVMVHWTTTKSWPDFYGEIVTFCQRNNQTAPTDEEVQNIVCGQLPTGWCVSPGGPTKPYEGRSGCSSCGGRR